MDTNSHKFLYKPNDSFQNDLYVILNSLYHGNFVQTYLINNNQTNKQFSMKVILHRDSNTESHSEFKAIKKLKPHANLIKYIDSFQTNMVFWHVITEYCEGKNLAECIRAKTNTELGMFPRSLVIRWCKEILTGLEFIHRNGIIHRDIKPHNILLVDRTGQIKITADFGLSKDAAKILTESLTSWESDGYGTLYYLSPEIVNKIKNYDNKVDIWSAGCVFYEILTLMVAFGKFSIHDVFKAIIKKDLTPLSESESIEFHFLVERSIKLDPTKRFSASQLLEGLKKIKAEKSVGSAKIDEKAFLQDSRISLSSIQQKKPKDGYECKQTLIGHTGSVWTLVITADGKLISGSADFSIKIWDIESGKCLRTLTGHTDGVRSLVISSEGNKLVSGSTDKFIKVWHIERGSCLRTFSGHKNCVTSLVKSRDGWVISGSGDSLIKIWDIERGKCFLTLEGHEYGVRSLAMSPQDDLISGSGDCSIKIWNIKTGACLRTLVGQTWSLVISDEGKLITGSWDNSIKVWNAERGNCVGSLAGHEDSIFALVFGEDEGQIISGSIDKTIKVWNIENGQCLQVLNGHTNYVNALVMSREGRLISGSADSSIKVWGK